MLEEMDNIEIASAFEEFLKEYDVEKMNQIWEQKSEEFRDFWNNRIMKGTEQDLNDEEIDKIIKILDRNAKGNTRQDIAVAKAMVPQGAWRRMFKELKQNTKLKEALNKVLTEEDENKLSDSVNNLYKINEGNKNNLTGKSANAVDDMLFAYNPKKFISVISLNDRERIIEYFGFKGPDFEKDSQGKKIVQSNKVIIGGFREIIGKDFTPRTISDFVYLKVKDFWKKSPEEDDSEENTEIPEEKIGQFEERIYQKLVHRNFKIIFPDLDYYDAESQNDKEGHYDTEAGIMDFFCKDKKGDFVVIELKKDSSDKTVGQICRYMGWVKETLCTNGQKVRGIIISEIRDPLIDYALSVVPHVIFKRMKLEVRLKDWE